MRVLERSMEVKGRQISRCRTPDRCHLGDDLAIIAVKEAAEF